MEIRHHQQFDDHDDDDATPGRSSRKAFRAIPEEIVEDTLDYLEYVMCTRSSSHSLIENEILTEVVDFLVLFSGAS